MRGKKRLVVGIVVSALILGGLITVVVTSKSDMNSESYKDIQQDRGDFGNGITVFDAEDGEIVIDNKLVQDISKKNDMISKRTATPDTIWDQEVQAGKFTNVEKTKMKDGSIGTLMIPDLNLSANVFESKTTDTMAAMKQGVAHFPNTSTWDGNIALSAHNINFDGSDGYFLNLYKLKEGDTIVYETVLGTRTYIVVSIRSISDSDWSPLAYSDSNKITLITCITGQATKRLCVEAIEK